jgi:ATP-dependent Lon protease
MAERESDKALDRETPVGAVHVLAVVPMKQTVLYPHVALPALVGRPASVEAVKAALATEEKTLVVVAQRDPGLEEPGPQDLYTVGRAPCSSR